MLRIRIDIEDAQKFIAERLKSSTDELCIVTIEPKIRQLEFLPCLLAAREAYRQYIGGGSNLVAAVKAFREACQARGFDINLIDAKNVVEQFII